jgi:energy-coupling factor transporter ATP-binding protein EcfA2
MLKNVDSFGNVEAEEDAVLQFFVSTSITSNIENGKSFLVLGRKGSGKTALFRYFTEDKHVNHSTGLNLNGYPWKIHETIKDEGVENVESYVASWKYLIAIELAKLAIDRANRPQMTEVIAIREFLSDNYGTQSPTIKSIFALDSLKISGDLEPQLFGCKLGKISLQRTDKMRLGHELNALTEKLLESVVKISNASDVQPLYLHFDELDRGITELSDARKEMIIGLVLAAKETNKYLNDAGLNMKSVVFLRTDIWEQLKFSDKNKISQTNSDKIEWDDESLLGLMNKRIQVKLGDQHNWETIDDGKRIKRQQKWKHIIDRSFMRPRDVISFMNLLLETVKKLEEEEIIVFENRHVVDARPKYSQYLKSELDDEISTHWTDWEMCLQTLSKLGLEYFTSEQYTIAYNEVQSGKNPKYNAMDSLEELYNFGIIGYEARSGYGGSGWKTKFANPELGWDSNAIRFKVHLGLKEFMKLKEGRS